jgi:periplasmic mercuric ion binding protein
MIFVKRLSIIAAAALVFAGCKDTAKDGNINTNEQTVTDTAQVKETAANTKTETATFKISGMTCPMGCAATIQQKLTDMDGVEEAKVDFDSKTATILFDPAKQTTESFVQTVEKIADGAYKVSDVKTKGDKAYFDAKAFGDKDKKKKAAKANTEKKATAKETTAKDKKGGCCSGHTDAKKSCHAEKSASM